MFGQCFCTPPRLPTLVFHPLYSSFLCLTLAGRSLFFLTSVLAFLPDFLFDGMELSWAWRRWSLNIYQPSWATHLSRALSHGNFPSTPLKRPKPALWSPGFWACFSLSSLPSGSWTPSRGHCIQGCLWYSQPQWALPIWRVWGPAEHLFLLGPLSLGGRSYHQCTPGTSRIAYALLCCSSNRYDK